MIIAVVELTPKLTSEAFYNGEVENEVRMLVSENKLNLRECVYHHDSDRDHIMDKIESIRSNSIYPHVCYTKECKQRGTCVCNPKYTFTHMHSCNSVHKS